MGNIPLDCRLTVLKAGQGTGKTEAGLGAFAGKEPVLLLTHRCTLAKDLQSRYNRLAAGRTEVGHYQQVGPLDTYSGSLAIVVNSLYKLDIREFRNAYVYIDEVSQLLAALSDRILDDSRERVVRSLSQLLRVAKAVIVADKDVTHHDVTLLSRWMNLTPSQVRVIHNSFVRPGRQLHWHHNEPSILTTLLSRCDAGRSLFVASDSKAKCDEIAQLLQDHGLSVCKFTGDIDDDKRASLMQDINLAVRDYDAMVVSPALFTGVDLSQPHFDDVFLLATNTGQLSSRDYLQGLHRVRNPKGEVHVWLHPVSWNKPVKKSCLIQQNCGSLLMPFDLDEQTARDLHSGYWNYRDHFIESKTAKNQDINNLATELRELLVADGYEILPPYSADPALADLAASVELVTAQAVTKEERTALQEAIINVAARSGESRECSTVTIDLGHTGKIADEYYRLNGNSYEDFEHIVCDIDPRKFAAKVENFELLLEPQETVFQRERHSIRSSLGINPKGLQQRSQLLKDIVVALGGNLRRSTPISSDESARVLLVLQEHDDTLQRFFGQKVPQQPKLMKTLTTLLKKAGLELNSVQKRVNRQRVRDYNLNQHSVELMYRVAGRRQHAHHVYQEDVTLAA